MPTQDGFRPNYGHNKLKFVRLPDDRVLLVNAPNRVVVGEVKE